MKVPPKTYDLLVELAEREGFITHSGKPIVSHTVLKMIRIVLDADNDPEWEKLRENSEGSTINMVKLAVTEHLKKRRRANY